jgi:hypothetical protein
MENFFSKMKVFFTPFVAVFFYDTFCTQKQNQYIFLKLSQRNYHQK